MSQDPEQFVGGTPPCDGGAVVVCDRDLSGRLSILFTACCLVLGWLSQMESRNGARKASDSVLSIEVSDSIPDRRQRVSGPEVNLARRRYQKGSIRRRGNRWDIRWREDVLLPGGKIKREQRTTLLGTVEQFPTRRLAEREAVSFLSRVNRFDYRPVKRAVFFGFTEHWEEQVLDLLKPSTAKVMRSHLRFHLVPAFGQLRLDEIGQEQVQAFVAKLSKGRSRHTVQNVLGTLASVLKMARKWGYAVAGFKQDDLVIPCSKPARPGRFFTAEQMRLILSLATEPWRTIFALAAMTGLRPGEVLGLSIDDLDFEQHLIFVRCSAWYRHLIFPKSTRSVATVPMPEPLAEILTNYLASWRPNEKKLLFSNLRGNPHSENKVVQKRLWPILDTLSIPRCGMHAFRHSHGSLLHSSGASLKVAQNQLRHADASTTSRYYLHVVPSEQREAVEKVARILCPDVARKEVKLLQPN